MSQTETVRILFLGDSKGAVRSVGAVDRSLGGLSTRAIMARAALGAVFGIALKGAVDFDRAMRNVNSIVKLSESQFKALEKRVLALSKTSGQSPKVLADGLYDIVSSGFAANDALKVLTASARAGTAGMTDTATAAKAVTAALNAYHRPAGDARAVSDSLFKTVELGVLRFEELAQNMGDLVPAAAPLGVSLEEVGAAMSTITLQGVPAAEAATRVKNSMLQLASPSKAMAALLKANGYESAEAAIKAVGYAGVLEMISTQTDGNVTATSKLVPEIRALMGIVGLTGKNLATYNKHLLEQRKASAGAGATAKAFAEQSKAIGVQWDKARGAMIAAAVPLAELLFPWLKKGAAQGQLFAESLTEHQDEIEDGFRSLSNLLGDVGEVLKEVADLAGGWDELFKIILTGVLAKKVYELATAFGVLAGAETAAGGAGLAGAAGQSGRLLGNLNKLKAIGLISIPIGLYIFRDDIEKGGEALLEKLGLGGLVGGGTISPTDQGLPDWVREALEAKGLGQTGVRMGGAKSLSAQQAQVERLIEQFAADNALDPAAVKAVAMGEGGLKWGAQGDRGIFRRGRFIPTSEGPPTSFGPFQMHLGGALPLSMSGAEAAAFANSPKGIQAALQMMARGGAAGLTGEAAIRAIISNFERPADIPKSIAAALGRYGQFTGAGAGGGGAGAGSKTKTIDLSGDGTEPTLAAEADVKASLGALRFLLGRIVKAPEEIRPHLKARLGEIKKLLTGTVTDDEIRVVQDGLGRLMGQYGRATSADKVERQLGPMTKKLHAVFAADLYPPKTEKAVAGQMGKLRLTIKRAFRDGIVTDAELSAVRAKLARITDFTGEALTRANDVVDAQRENFAGKWSSLADRALRVFDERTQKDLEAWKVSVSGTFNGLFERFDFWGAAKTPSEILLEHEEAAEAAAARAETLRIAIAALAEANARLRELRAQGYGEQSEEIVRQKEEIARLERDAAVARLAERRVELQTRAAEERAAAEALLASQKAAYADQRAEQRVAFELELVALGEKLRTGKVKTEDAQAQVLALMKKYGISYAEASGLIGEAFSGGFGAAVEAIERAVKRIELALRLLAAIMQGRVAEARRLRAELEALSRLDEPVGAPYAGAPTGGGGAGLVTIPQAGGGNIVYDPVSGEIAFRPAPGGGPAYRLPGFAEGGLVDRPTLAMVGEKEPELIVPLSKLRGMGGLAGLAVGGGARGGGSPVAVSIFVDDAMGWLKPYIRAEAVGASGDIALRIGEMADRRRRSGRA